MPAIHGWVLNEDEGRPLNAILYLPPGKGIPGADRSLAIDADRKTDFGTSLEQFAKNHIRHYRNVFEGDVAGTSFIPSYTGKPVELYYFRPKPGLSYGIYQSSVFIEEPQCFIHLHLGTSTEQGHKEYMAAFKALVAGFKPKAK